MAQEIRALLNNTVARVEAVVPRTTHDESGTFAHVETAIDAEDLVDNPRSRRFVVVPTGAWDAGADVHQVAELPWVTTELEVGIVYRQGHSAWETTRTILEDVDEIAYELTRTDGDRYEASTTELWRRRVLGYGIEPAAAKGGGTILRLRVECSYRPKF